MREVSRKALISALILTLGGLVFALEEPASFNTKKDLDLKSREYMQEISKELNVTCNYCHDVSNFRSNKLPNFKISKAHIELVKMLNQKGFGTEKVVRADCYMCHRGEAKPNYKRR